MMDEYKTETETTEATEATADAAEAPRKRRRAASSGELVSFTVSHPVHLPGCGLQPGKDQQRDYSVSDFRNAALRPTFVVDMQTRTLTISSVARGKLPARTHTIPFENLSSLVTE